MRGTDRSSVTFHTALNNVCWSIISAQTVEPVKSIDSEYSCLGTKCMWMAWLEKMFTVDLVAHPHLVKWTPLLPNSNIPVIQIPRLYPKSQNMHTSTKPMQKERQSSWDQTNMYNRRHQETNTVEFSFALEKLFLNDILKRADKAQVCQGKQNWVGRFLPALWNHSKNARMT